MSRRVFLFARGWPHFPQGRSPKQTERGEAGHEGGDVGAWRRKENEKKQGEGTRRPGKFVSTFTRYSRRVFLCAYGYLDDERDGVRVLRALRCLQG